jgi:hypothetical protein
LIDGELLLAAQNLAQGACVDTEMLCDLQKLASTGFGHRADSLKNKLAIIGKLKDLHLL